MSIIKVENLSAGYSKKQILKEVSLEVLPGEMVGIIGANGSGKTTLIKALCGVIERGGSVFFGNTNANELSVKEFARHVSYIPQRSGISIDISTLDVVMMGFNPQLGLLAYPSRKMKEKALKMLEQVGILDKANENFLHLSEGQKQLCILARAMVADSKLLLLDEPESALDFHYRYAMMKTLKDYVAEDKRAALVALHDTNLALNNCDKLIILVNGCVGAIISPGVTPVDVMEEKLGLVYGPVSLHRLANKSGVEQFVMLRED